MGYVVIFKGLIGTQIEKLCTSKKISKWVKFGPSQCTLKNTFKVRNVFKVRCHNADLIPLITQIF